MNSLRYKNYVGMFSYDSEADLFHGRVVNINDVVTFEGRSIDELKQALADSVKDYLEFCVEVGKEPDKPFSGRFNLRLTPELHRAAAAAAKQENKSLNAWVAEKVEEAVRSKEA
jgi:predicted HicB family RNase H-like nuclease